MQVRYQLTTLKKGSQPIAGYFQQAQGFAHMLAAIDHPLQESDVVSYILAGISADYDPLVTSITTRQEPIHLDDLSGHLLSYELQLEQHTTTVDLLISSANMAQQ
jgi:hypothetical protein